MNEKEVSEIRRRYKAEKSGISHIRGCYVNEKKEIISQFDQSLSLISEEEANELLTLLKKTLSGGLGKNLLDIEFSTQQVLESEEHKLLSSLRSTSLRDEAIVQKFFEQAIASLTMEGNYMILLAYDSYDVFSMNKEGEKDDSSQVFNYIICAICPMKEAKPTLSYYVYESKFRNVVADSVIGAPVLGFMFPAFNDRAADIYHTMYYSRDIADNHPEFIEGLFHAEAPMPPAIQKETFQSILSHTVAEDCSYEVVQTVHGQLSAMIEDHKANKEVEPLVIGKEVVKDVLNACGVSEERVSAFEERYDESFGEETALRPGNLVNVKQFEVRTPDVVIKVDPEKSGLLETRIIDGVKYILIRADAGVEVNGVNICIQERKEENDEE